MVIETKYSPFKYKVMNLVAFSASKNENINDSIVRIVGALGHINLSNYVSTNYKGNVEKVVGAEVFTSKHPGSFLLGRENVLRYTHPGCTAISGFIRMNQKMDKYGHAKVHTMLTQYTEPIQKTAFSKIDGTFSFCHMNTEHRFVFGSISRRCATGQVVDNPLHILAMQGGIIVSDEEYFLMYIQKMEERLGRNTRKVTAPPDVIFSMKQGCLSQLYSVKRK